MTLYQIPLKPKNDDGKLRVLTLGRISTIHQDIAMLEVQYREVEQTLQRMWDGPFELTKLGEQRSGEDALRESYVSACEMIESGELDLVILYDFSKAGRSPQFMHRFANLCVDHETRFICTGDNIDTAEPGWKIAAGAAAFAHGTQIYYTRRRVRSKAVDTFHRGGMMTKLPYGFLRLTAEQAASGEFGAKELRAAKVDSATPHLREMMRQVMAGATYESVARWLRDEGVPTGPDCKSGRWYGKLVKWTLENPKLHGEFFYGRDQILRKEATSVKFRRRAKQWERKTWPELAHLTVEEHEQLLAEMQRRKEAHPRRQRSKVGPKGRARSRTLFPGQLITCGWCGAPAYWHGKGSLKCSGIGDREAGGCQNRVEIDPRLVRQKVLGMLMEVFSERPELRQAMVEFAVQETRRVHGREDREVERIESQLKQVDKERINLARALAKGMEDEKIDELFAEVKTRQAKLIKQRQEAEQRQQAQGHQPLEPAEVEQQLEAVLSHLLEHSHEMSDLMRRIIPVFTYVPLQAVDSGKPVVRAQVTFSFASLDQRRPAETYAPQEGDFSVQLDLWEPPAHIACLNAVARVSTEHPDWSAEKLGAAVGGVKRWTVRSALKLLETMQAQGAAEPYVPVTDPDNVSRWRTKNSGKARWDQAA